MSEAEIQKLRGLVGKMIPGLIVFGIATVLLEYYG